MWVLQLNHNTYARLQTVCIYISISSLLLYLGYLNLPNHPPSLHQLHQLWENWEGLRYLPGGTQDQSGSSWNHVMFGSNGAWHFEHVAGIRMPFIPPNILTPTPWLNGWKRVIVSPSLLLSPAGNKTCAKVSWAKAAQTTRRGPLDVIWHCTRAGMNLTLTLPIGSTALVRLPLGQDRGFGETVTEHNFCEGSPIWSGGAFVKGCAGVVAGEMATDGLAVELEVVSGTYTFVVA